MAHQQTAEQSSVFSSPADEQILVIKRDLLFPAGGHQGLKALDAAEFQDLIRVHGEFMWRSLAETDFAYKQIIPYLVFRHQDTFFVMQRKSDASEVRLRSKYTLGIGGHVREGDIQHADIAEWAAREFAEEVEYKGSYKATILGLLNDDSDLVGRVHVGVVMLLEGDSSDIAVRSELKHGRLFSLKDCAAYYDVMESWSQMVYDFLHARHI